MKKKIFYNFFSIIFSFLYGKLLPTLVLEPNYEYVLRKFWNTQIEISQ